MIRNLLAKLDRSLRTQKGHELSPARPSSLDVLCLEDRVLYSAVPLVDPAELQAANAPDATELDAALFSQPAGDAVAADNPASDNSLSADTLSPEADAIVELTVDAALRHEIVFIDSAVEDIESLLADLLSIDDPHRDIEVVLLDAQQDGIEQIGQLLGRRSDIDAVHILSHGDGTGIQLGNSRLDGNSAAGYAGDLASWSSALTVDADILIYGCDLASTTQGRTLIESLAAVTEADVAASDDLTGHAQLGGNWSLEYAVGEITTQIALGEAAQQEWLFVLTTAPTTSDHTVTMNEDTPHVFTAADFDFNDIDGDPLAKIQITRLESVGSLQLSGVDVTFNQEISRADIDAGNLTFTAAADANGSAYDSFDYRVSDGTNYSAAASITTYVDAAFDADADGFTYADLVNGGWVSGAYDVTYGQTGGGLRIGMGTGNTVGPVSGAWSRSFTLTEMTEITISTDYRLVISGEMESLEYGELFLRINGVDYGDDVNSTLVHQVGDGNGGLEHDSGWQSYETTITLGAGTHSLELVAYGNGTTYADEWVAGYFDNVSVTEGHYNVLTMDVTAVNDDPSNTGSLPTDITVSEDVSGNVDLSAINLSDVDHGGGNLTLALSTSTGGNLSATSGAGVTAGGSGTAALTLTGTLADLNAYLDTASNVQYLHVTADMNGNDADTIAVTINDNGNTGVGGGTDVSLGSVNVDIAAVNDAPVNILPGSRTVFINDNITFSTATNSEIEISDVDAGGSVMQVSLISTNGTMTLGGTSGLTFSTGDGTADNSMTFTGTTTAINAALDAMVYTPTADYLGTASIQVTTSDQGNSGSGGTLSDIDVITINVIPTHSISLWLSTDKESVTSGGTSWTDGEVISFAAPGLAFEPGTTAGTFSSVFDLDSFALDGDADMSGVHRVSHSVVVGTGANSATLNKGDMLLSIQGSETLGGVNVTELDLVLFRPTVAGDYSSGTFSILINSPTGDKIRDIALVEKAITVGGVALNAGDLLLVQSSGAYDKDIWRFEATSVGNGTTAGTFTELIDGSDIGFSQQIGGFALIQTETTMGNATLAAGELLVNLRGSTNVGNNSLSVSRHDIFRLSVSQAGVNTLATASLLFEGADVGLSSAGEEFHGLALVATNYAPTLAGANDFTSIAEDAFTNTGTLVSSLISGHISGPDDSPIWGIAVTAADNTNGSWQYSVNAGGSWSNFGSPSHSAARLLASDGSTLIRFVPSANYNGDASIEFRAWDQTSGSIGAAADTTTNGGASAFSTATANSTVTVTAVNDAPVLDNSGAMTLTTVSEDQTANGGNTVASILLSAGGDRVTDVDSGAVEGIAITSLSSSNGSWEYSIDAGGSWLTVGAVSDASALLLRSTDLVRFVPNAATGTTASFDFRAWDQTSGSAGSKVNVSVNGTTTAWSSAIETASILVSDVNDAAVASSIENTALAYSENDGAVAITSTLALSDVDDTHLESAVVQITANYVSGQDVLSFTDQNGITGSWNAGTATLTLTGSATLADYETALRSVTYSNSSDTPSTLTRTVAFTVNDGDVASNTLTRDVAVTAVNDDPSNVGSLPTDITVGEDISGNVNLSAINLSDVDHGGGNLTLTLSTSTGGNLSATSGAGVTVGGSGTAALSLTGTLADLNTYLDTASNVQYLHATAHVNGNNADTIAVTINDNGNTGAGGGTDISLGSVNVDIAALNDAPLNTLPGTQTIAEETTTAIGGISIADVDAFSGNLTTRLQVTAGVLDVTLSGAATVSAGSNSSADLTIRGTVADINATLASLSYTGNTNVTGTAADSLTVTTNDAGNTGSGGARQDVDVIQIDLTAVNDAPVISAPGSALTATEQVALAIHGVGFGVSDADEASGGATATISVGEGSLTVVVGDSGVTVDAGNGSAAVTLSGSIAQINHLLTAAGTGTISYLNASDTPAASTVITVTVNDQGNTGVDPGLTGDGTSEQGTNSQTINLTALNDAPSNAGSLPTDITVGEDISGNVDLSAINLSDVDHGGGNLTLTLSTSTGGNLSATGGAGVTVGGSGTAALTLTGTLADLNTYLGTASNVQYLHATAHVNGNNADTIAVTINDNGNTGVGGGTDVSLGSVNVDIAAVNDAPVNTLPGSRTVFINGNITFSAAAGSQIEITDVDAGGAVMQVSLVSTNGTMTLSDTSGLTFSTGDGTADSSMTFTGTITAINDALDAMAYTPTADYSGTASIQVSTSDQGNSGSGGTLSDTDVITINVIPTHSVSLWLTTQMDTTASGGTSWTDGEVIGFAAPGLAFEPGTTSGVFSSIFDLDSFALDGDADMSGLHRVSDTVVIGIGANSRTLLKGDVLLTIQGNETLGGVAVSEYDVVLFRPTAVDDYSSGTFSILINTPTGDSIREIALVEKDIVVGGLILKAGDILGHSDDSFSKDIWRFRASSVGDGTTAGSITQFIDGSDIGFSGNIGGLALVQTETTIGDVTLAAGELLVSLRDDSVVGSNNLAVTDHDIFRLNLSQAGGTTVATASLLFEGADVGLSSDGEEFFGLALVATNYAPTLAGANDFTSIAEDAFTNTGTLVSSLISGQIGDSDGGALAGIAVTAVDNTNGSWQYSVNAGGSWSNLGTPTHSAARLLASDGSTLIRFVPNANYNGDASIEFRAWDQTSGSIGAAADTTTNGGASAFSTATANSTVTVTAVNDAPVLDNSGTMTLTTVSEDQTANGGDTVASILSSAGGDRVTDVDSGAVEGIAITSLSSSNGSWRYSIDAGGSWMAVGSVSDASALLLRSTDLVRFVPNAATGTTASFDFRAWDQTSGSAGSKVDVSVNGTTTAWSSAIETASILASDVNDEETVVTNTGDTVAEGSTGNVVTTAMLQTSDVDNTPSQLLYTLTAVPTNGTLRRSGIDLSLSSTFTQADIDAGIITYSHDDSETSSDAFSFTVDDGMGSISNGTFNIAVTPVNDNAPLITSDGGAATAAIDVAENSTAVTTVIASDIDLPAQTLTYSLAGGADVALFTIDSNSGALQFIAAQDREVHADLDVDGVYEVTVQASDGGLTRTQAISVTVTDVDEFDVGTVIDTDAAINAVNENAAVGSVVGVTAAASDADATTNAISYSLADNDGGRFQIDNNTGVVTVAGAIDREADGPARSITVRATSADGSFSDQAIVIQINDVDEFDVGAVTDTDATINAVNENAAVGTVVGVTAAATDVDATTNAISYSLADNDGGRFQIDNNTGIVTVAGAIDREADGPARSITVRATSVDGSFTDQAFAIQINDVDEFDVGAVTDTDAAINAVNENAAVGTVVGVTAAASDADATTNAISYSLADNDGGRFQIDISTGVVTVAGAIDREADGPARSITVRATSVDGSFTDQAFAIQVNDVDEFDVGTIVDSDGATNRIFENAAVGTAVGITAQASDADATTNTVVYALQDNDGGRFSIEAGTGIVRVAGLVDREADGPSRAITVRATSADGSFTDQTYTVSVDDVDEYDISAITDADGTANGVNENAAVGTAVGLTALASDADATDNLVTYTLEDDAGGRFAIDSVSGMVTVADGSLLDYEAGTSHTVLIRATGSDLSTTTATMSIAVNDVNEAPTDLSPNAFTVAENTDTSAGYSLGSLSTTDQDAAETFSYSIAGGPDAAAFSVGGFSGDELILTDGILDYEAKSTYTVNVRVTDSGGNTYDELLTVSLTDNNDAPVAAADLVTVNEDGSVSGNVLTNDTDQDAGDVLTAVLVSDVSSGVLVLNPNGSFTYTPAADFNGTDQFSYQAFDGTDNSATVTVTIAIAPVDDSAIAVPDFYAGNASETLVVSPQAGLLSNDVEIDGESLSAKLVSAPTSGSLTLNADGSFTYVPQAGYVGSVSFSYVANDGNADSAPISVVLELIGTSSPSGDDVDEDHEEPPQAGGNVNTDPDTDEQKEVREDSVAPPARAGGAADADPAQRDRTLQAKMATSLLSGAADVGDSYAHSPNQVLLAPVITNANDRIEPNLLNSGLVNPFAAYATFEFDVEQMRYSLEKFADDLAEAEQVNRLVAGTATCLFVGATVGVAIWAVNTSALLSFVGASIPAWTRFDPIFLVRNYSQQADQDDASIAEIINQSNLESSEVTT